MDTIYWAVKLTEESKVKLLSAFPAVHPNIYAEHMTIVFRPDDHTDSILMKECGSEVALSVIGYAQDARGQAVVVDSDNVSRIGGGVAHITISCANGTKPAYSNELLKKHYDSISPIKLDGVIARFTKIGWDICKE